MSAALDTKRREEDAFCCVMDATEQYLEIRERLTEAFKKVRIRHLFPCHLI